jgi:hypothetical protein
MHSGNVPWFGREVTVIKGPRRLQTGTVVDVLRRQNTRSRMKVNIRLNLLGQSLGNFVMLDYDAVIDTQ